MEFALNEILTIIDKVKSTDLAMFEYQDADTRIRIRGTKKTGKKMTGHSGVDLPRVQDISAAVPETQGRVVTSPMVGTFYTAASEQEEPFVRVGDRVKKGQTIGIIEAMKLMNEIESEWEGIVTEILVKNEQMVEYGQPLVRIEEEKGC